MQISGHRTSLIFFLMALWLGAGFPATRAQSWNEDSFEDFADGRLDASGQNLYVSRNGTVRTVHRFDLNQDGYLDLIFNNTHDSITYVDATWAGFDAARTLTHSTLAVLGSLGAVAGDLNRDGFTDLVFCPNPDGIQHPRRFISIAWGAAEGWSSNRISGVLPAWDPRAVAIADLNRDGWPDIVVLAQAPRRQPGGKPVESMVMKVFWGSRLGFYLGRRQIHELPVSVDLKAGDFDGDGARDVAVLTAENEIRVFWATRETSPAPVSLNSTGILLRGPEAGCLAAGDIDGDGLTDLAAGTSQRTLFTVTAAGRRSWNQPVRARAAPASHISIGDLDADGHADLALTEFGIRHAAGGERGAADRPGGIRILWGEAGKYDPAHSLNLRVDHPSASAIGDLDGDGRPDLAAAVYQGTSSFSAESAVFFGNGHRSFRRARRGIPSSGASDVLAVPAEGELPARVVVCNSQGGALDERVPLYVYWGGKGGFDPDRRLVIPFSGGYGAVGADLNADGINDLVAMNSGHGGQADPDVGAHILWGTPRGFDLEGRRTILSENHLSSGNVADLDRDGYLDLVLNGFDPAQTILYYGSATGYHRTRRLVLPSVLTVADFNRDGWLDLSGSSPNGEVGIVWGGPEGPSRELEPIGYVPWAGNQETADLNADGHLDLIVGGYADPTTRTFDVGLFVFWGSVEGFTPWNTQWLPGMGQLAPLVADFDRDGFLDLFAPSYHGTGVRESMPSYLFWGSRDGLRAENKTRLVCDSASDAMAGDFDQDGRLDLAVICHTRHGDHRIDSKVFYNDGKRFIAPRTVGLPTLGGHTIYLTDVGHIYDRSWRQAYDSSLFHWDGDRSGGRLQAKAETSAHSRLSFRIRSGAIPSGLEQKPWRQVNGDRFPLESSDRVLQYQAVFESGNGDSYPILDRVSIELSSD